MEKEQKARMIKDFLEEEGFRSVSLDKDGDVVFKAEGRNYLILADGNDEPYYPLIFPNFWPIESEQERGKVIIAAHHATAKTKAAKVYTMKDNLWASVECFYDDFSHFKAQFNRNMRALQAAVNNFREKMQEL